MGPLGVVLDSPVLDDPPGLGHGDEPVLVQALVAEFAVEALDVGVLDRLARTDKRQLHTLLERPGIQRLALEVRTVAHCDRLRQSAGLGEPLEHPHRPSSRQRGIDLDGQTFPRTVVHDHQAPQLASIR